MRDDVFKEYYKTMASIINYKEKDANGNERKCTVSLAEAKKNLNRYKTFACTLPDLKGKQFAYDPELVKKHTDVLRKLCSILPQEKEGLSYDIWLKTLVQENSKQKLKDAIIGETFFAMCEECDIMRSFGPASSDSPRAIRRNFTRTNSINLQRRFDTITRKPHFEVWLLKS